MVKTFYPIQTSFSILGYFSQSTTFDYNSAFKLETGQPIIFDSNIVRLVQKINFVDSNFEYGLTAQ